MGSNSVKRPMNRKEIQHNKKPGSATNTNNQWKTTSIINQSKQKLPSICNFQLYFFLSSRLQNCC